MTAPAYVATGTVTISGTSVPWPASTPAGALGLLLVVTKSGGATTTPSGWTDALGGAQTTGSGSAQVTTQLFYNTAVSSPPAATLSSLSQFSAAIFTFSGANTSNPLGGKVVSLTTLGALATWPTYTTTVANCLAFNAITSSASFTPTVTGAYTALTAITSAPFAATYSTPAATTGSQGGAALTSSGSNPCIVIEYAIAPAASSSPISGTTSLANTLTGTMAATGSVAGTTGLSSTMHGILLAAGLLAGSVGLSNTSTGTMGGTGSIAGTTGIANTLTGTLIAAAPGAMVGTTSLTNTLAGTLNGAGNLAGSTGITNTLTGTLAQLGALSGTTSLTSTLTGTLAAVIPIAGVTSISNSLIGTLSNAGPPLPLGYNSAGVSFDAIFAPNMSGRFSAPSNLKIGGADINTKYELLSYGTAAPPTGYRTVAGGLDVNTLWAAIGTAVYSLPIQGINFAQGVLIPSSGSGDAAVTFQCTPSAYAVTAGGAGGTLTPGNGTLAGGALPGGAVSAMYSATLAPGYAHGTLTNGATSITALTGNPGITLVVSGRGTGPGADSKYIVTCTLYNAASAAISSTTFTLEASYDGSA